MKRTSLLLATLLAGSVALAEPPSGPPGGGRDGPSIERLTKELGLDTNQQAAVKEILDEQRSKMQAERAQVESSGTRPSREEMMAKMEQMNSDLRAKLANVLTAEQLTKFDEMRKRQRPMGSPPDGAPQ